MALRGVTRKLLGAVPGSERVCGESPVVLTSAKFKVVQSHCGPWHCHPWSSRLRYAETDLRRNGFGCTKSSQDAPVYIGVQSFHVVLGVPAFHGHGACNSARQECSCRARRHD